MQGSHVSFEPPPGAFLGIFSSELDSNKQVKSVGTVICSCRKPGCKLTHYLNEDGTHGPWECPMPTRRETIFRHSGWLPKRARVAAALESADVSDARRKRFACCGAGAFIEVDEATGKMHYRAFCCGDRFCDACGKSRGVRARSAIATLLGPRASWFITLTQAGRKITCVEALDTLNKRLKLLRKNEVFAAAFDGGVFVTEVKIGRGSGEWHVHMHGIMTGPGMSKERLSDVWHKVTGDSWQVDLQEVRSPERAGSYVAKYLSKGFDGSLSRDPARLRECIDALGGRRLLVTWGSWYNAIRDDHAPEPGRRRVVGGLERILSLADAGDEWALGVIFCLRRSQGLAADQDVAAGIEGLEECPPPGS